MRCPPLTVVVPLVAGCLSLAALEVPAAAAQDHRLTWSDDWTRVHPVSYAVTPAVGIGAVLFGVLYESPEEAWVRGPILFDAPVRTRLASDAASDRELAAAVSDVLLGGLILWPFVDSLAVSGLGDWNSDVAFQLSWIAVESLTADYLLSTLIKALVHRERPHGQRCSIEDRTAHPGRCGTHGRTRSFYSGHASAAFNAAGGVCLSHAYLPLYERPAADAFACGAALTLASIVGVLRIVADRHYTSDVLVGALMGLGTGLLMPWLLHYRSGPPDGPAERSDGLPERSVRVPLMGGHF